MARDLLAEFPIRVSFPLAGKYQLLEWWSEDEQKHVVMGRTLEGLVAVWKHILVSKDAKPTGYYTAELVAPPLALRQLHAERCLEKELLDFKDWVGVILYEYVEGSKEAASLPLQKCPDANEDYHSCEKCFMGSIIVGHTLQSFYEAKRVQFLKHYRREDEGVVSKAPELASGQPLFAVVYAPGHHSSGTYIHPIENYNNFWVNDVLLFFTGAEEKVPSAIIDPYQQHRQQENEAAARSTEDRKSQRVKEKSLRFREVEKLIKELFP